MDSNRIGCPASPVASACAFMGQHIPLQVLYVVYGAQRCFDTRTPVEWLHQAQHCPPGFRAESSHRLCDEHGALFLTVFTCCCPESSLPSVCGQTSLQSRLHSRATAIPSALLSRTRRRWPISFNLVSSWLVPDVTHRVS